MKKILIIFILGLASNLTYSQIETTHLLKYEKTINPLFSKKLNQIVVSFEKSNLIDSPQNSFKYLKVDISDRKSELNGVVNDFNLGGAVSAVNNYGVIGGLLASSFSSSKYYSFRNTNGFIVLNKIQFDTLLKYSGKISQLVKSIKNSNLNNEKTYFFQIDKIILTLEVNLNKDYSVNSTGNTIENFTQKFSILFKIDESVFVFTDNEFEEFLLNSMLPIASIWGNDIL